MTTFTPIHSLLGVLLIGAAAVLLMALLGRVAGISGVLRGVLRRVTAGDWSWRLAFLAGTASAASPDCPGALQLLR